MLTQKCPYNNNIHTKTYANTQEPGLVAFYNIWPGNGAGLFLQPQNLHIAQKCWKVLL